MQPAGDNPEFPDAAQRLEKVVEQFTEEVRSGSEPSIESYLEKYPEWSDDLADMLSSVAMIEGLKNFSPSTSQPQSRFGDFEPPEYLGEYRIVREIGRGGMGVVLEAQHETLGRRVAIKVMAPGALVTSLHLERFHREAVAAASLHHTNIVSVFGAGEDQGFHFYVMEFVDGQSISQLLQRRAHENGETVALSLGDDQDSDGLEVETQTDSGMGNDGLRGFRMGQPQNSAAEHFTTDQRPRDRFRWVAQTCLQVADALAYAHEKALLHRDIKPANLVLDKNDTVWLTDFGLAKPMGVGVDEPAMTKTGDILGTPQYMAPESFSGNYDCRSETYCLGLTLYELATLRPAFAKGTTPEVIRAVTTATPAAPRKITREMPADLATIIEKAISKAPDQRYQSAADLRDDLRAFLEDRPVSAKRLSLLGQFVRFSRRNQLAATLMGMLILTLGLLAATAAVGYVATSSALENLKQKQVSLQNEQLATQEALNLADENAKKIESQFLRAETNVDVALEAFDQVFRQLIARGKGRAGDQEIDGFQEIAGVERAITKDDAAFVEKLVEFYQRLAIDSDHNRDFRTQSATAYRRIANVYRLVGENAKADQAYRSALDTYQQLMEEEPEAIEPLLNAVATRNELASLIGSGGQWREAMASLVLSRNQLESHPQADVPEVKHQLVRTLNQLTSGPVNLMFAQPNRNLLQRATQRAGVDVLAPLVDGRLKPARFIDMFAQVHAQSQRAVKVIQTLKQSDPDNEKLRVTRAESLCHFALLERMQDGDAMPALNAAMDELEGLQRDTPDQPQYKYLLAMTKAIASRDAQPIDARELLKEAQVALKDLVARFDRILPYRQLYSAVSIELAGLQLDAVDLELAKENLVLAGDLLLELKANSARDFGTWVNRVKLMRMLKGLGDALAAEGDLVAAAEVELIADRYEKGLGMN